MTRKTITIAEVGEIRTFGDSGKSLPIKATDGLSYQCFRPRLFEHLTVGATVECEVEEKRTEKGDNIYINRNIQDIFKDGQPVSGQRQGGGRSYGKSPEIVQYERASIEFNNAMSETGLCVREGKAPVDIETAYWGHLRRLLSRQPNAPQSAPEGQGVAPAPKPISTGIPQPRTALDEARDMDNAFEETVATDMVAGFANRGAFFTAAYEAWKLGPSEVGAIITTTDMQDLSKAWQKLEEKMKERNNG